VIEIHRFDKRKSFDFWPSLTPQSTDIQDNEFIQIRPKYLQENMLDRDPAA
jgi:hypothetical protein